MMSTDYRPLTDIVAADVFDGRLEIFGIHEHLNENTTETRRVLTDGRNYLWVFVTNGLAKGFTRNAGSGNPDKILNAIAKAFDVGIVSEYEPQFWGFNTKEEWNAAWDAMAKEDAEEFHTQILKFLNGEPHDIRPGTIGMQQAEIAKKLVEEDPTLLLPTNKSKLRDAIKAIDERDHVVTVTLGTDDLALAKMLVTHEDDLPRA